jgi:hypothetical protein
VSAVYVHGRRVVVAQQIQPQIPSTMGEAVRLAVAVETVEKHKQRWSEVRGRCWST